ncbi:MAG: LysR family transcriptional regulator [Gemmatimonadaceae bacterium]
MRLEIRDFRLVVAITELGTLTRAGQHLNLTQSALSHQLADLERRLDAALFERSGRRMIPNRLGARLASHGKELLQRLGDVERDVFDAAARREAVLRIATECYTCYHWLPPVLQEFRQLHPAVDVEVVPSATARPLAALIAGKIDLSIVSTLTRDRRIAFTPLFEDELLLIVAPDHRLAGRRFVDPAELRRERVLTYSRPDESTVYRRVLAPAGVSPRQITPIQLTEAMIELVKSGMGVGVLARWAVQRELDSGALVASSLGPDGVRRRWRVATRAAGATPAYLAAFVEFLRRVIAHPPRTAPQFTMLRSATRQGKAAVGA